jgi:predicted Zn finger-like uncharacterized protein
MAILVICPDCEAKFKASDELAGKKIRCRNCKEVIVVPSEDEDDDRPVRSKSRQQDEDDEPRRPNRNRSRSDDDRDEYPARSRSRRKPQKSSKALLFSLLGGGFVLLVGGCLVSLFLLGKSGSSGGWQDINESEAKFSVRMPTATFMGQKMPHRTLPMKNQPNASIKQVIEWMSLNPKSNQSFSVVYADIGDRKIGNDLESIRQIAPEIGVSAFLAADVEAERPIQIGNHPGKEFEIRQSNPFKDLNIPDRCYVRVVIVGNRLYVLTLETPKASKDSPDAKTFFDSFKIH